MTPRRHALRAVHYLVLALMLVLLVGPLVVPLLSSFKSGQEDLFGANAGILPQQWSLHAFGDLFEKIPIGTYLVNSVIVALLSIVSNLVLATAAGYMLSRRGWRGRNVVFYALIAGMMFPFEAIMISLFAQVRDLGAVDTLIGVWLPGAVAVLNILLMRAAFMALPKEIEDAALLDGATEWQRFWRIFLPNAKGVLTVITLTTFITAWDDFLWPLVVLRSDENFTLMLGLASLQGAFGFDYRVVLAGALVALVPVAVVFFAAQRHFFRGMEEGGVKF